MGFTEPWEEGIAPRLEDQDRPGEMVQVLNAGTHTRFQCRCFQNTHILISICAYPHKIFLSTAQEELEKWLLH